MVAYKIIPAWHSTDTRVTAHIKGAFAFAQKADEACQNGDPQAPYLCKVWASIIEKMREINPDAARFFGACIARSHEGPEDNLFRQTLRDTVQQLFPHP